MTPRQEQRLNHLLAAYRHSLPEVEASPAFLPQIWGKIEASRPVSWLAPLRIWALRLAATATAAAAILLGSMWIEQASQDENEALLNASYIDALTVDSMDETDGALWMLAEHEQ